MRIKILMLFSAAMLCFAQTATVYDLTPAESSEGARLYKAMNDARDAYNAWTEKIETRYVGDKKGSLLWQASDIGPLEFDRGFKHAILKFPDVDHPQRYCPLGQLCPVTGIAW